MYQLVHPTLLQSIAFRLWQIYLPKIVRQCGQLSSSPPGSAAHLWWAMMIGWVIWVMKVNQNVKKAPLSHQKMKCLVLDYIQLLMISWVTKFNWNVRKGLLSHHKMKCSFLDYVRLLIIGWATYNFQYVSWLFVSRTSSPYHTVMTIRQKFQERSSSTFYQSIPPPLLQNHYLILHLNRKLVNFNLKWIWIYGLEPHLPTLSNQKH